MLGETASLRRRASSKLVDGTTWRSPGVMALIWRVSYGDVSCLPIGFPARAADSHEQPILDRRVAGIAFGGPTLPIGIAHASICRRHEATERDGPLKKPATNRFFCPRLSEATHLLPLIRGHLVTVASECPLGTALDLVPIAEDGLFGYELIPDREAHTYLILACDAQGKVVLRRTSYSYGAPDALQLAAVNGHVLSRSERAARYTIQRRDSAFPDWHAAAEAVCGQLCMLFPDWTGQTLLLRGNARHLEEALRVALSHLKRWDPFIQFFGLPNEAQLGFVLTGSSGEQGELRFQLPNIWTMHWNARTEVVDESWSTVVEDRDTRADRAHGDLHFPDRRTHRRRVTNRGGAPDSWSGTDRRRTRGRRAMDHHDS
jgi:hypothetical protein